MIAQGGRKWHKVSIEVWAVAVAQWYNISLISPSKSVHPAGPGREKMAYRYQLKYGQQQ
jgi:hypothetical protein